MIRFGVVLSVVLVAIGLLVAGVVAGSLLLVVTSIGVAILAFLLLIIVVVISRHELFGQPARQAGGLKAIDSIAAAAGPPSLGKARSVAAGSGAVGALEPGTQDVSAGVAAHAGVPAQPDVRRSDSEISRGKGRKSREGGAGRRERVAPVAPTGGRDGSGGRQAAAAKAGAEGKADSAARQADAGRSAPVAPDRAAASATPDAKAATQRPTGSRQTAKAAPAAASPAAASPAAASPAAASPAAGSPAAASPAAASTAEDERGEQLTPAVQLIDAAAAKAKAGAEEVMHEAAAGRSSAARADQMAGGRPPAASGAADRPKEYRTSKLERESARAARARPAAGPGRDAEASRGSATAVGQAPGEAHATRSAAPGDEAQGQPRPGPADEVSAPVQSAGPANSSEGSEAIQVSVVPGITRYHRGDCLLIRFLSPDDLEVMTKQAAIDSGCVPCKACKPDEETTGARAG